MGQCLQQVLLSQTPEYLKQLLEFYSDKNYLIVADVHNKIIHVALRKGETAENVISAYYEAVLLGLTLCVYNEVFPVIYE